MAREVVANGDIVDFGRLGTLSPSFKSKVVPVGSEFNANVHITEPRVNLCPNATYFRLHPEEVSYERMEAKPKAKKKKDKPEGGGGASPAPDNGGHLGISFPRGSAILPPLTKPPDAVTRRRTSGDFHTIMVYSYKIRSATPIHDAHA